MSRAGAQSLEPAFSSFSIVVHAGAAGGEGSISPFAGGTIQSGRALLARGIFMSLDASAGREPLLVMQRAGAGVAAGYVGGWTTATSLRFAHDLRSSDVAIVGRMGTARADARTDAALNDVGRWTAFYDARFELRWFGRDEWSGVSRQRAASAWLRAYAGIRHDQRFHRAGDLSTFNDPTGRWVAGAFAAPLRFGSRGSARDGPPVLTIGAGFDFETALRTTDRLPSGLEARVRGDLDVMRAYRRRKTAASAPPRR